MKTYRKHIDGIYLRTGECIAREKLKNKEIGDTFIFTALNGYKAFRKTDKNTIEEVNYEEDTL